MFYKFFLPVLVTGGMGLGAWRTYGHPQDVNLPPGMAPSYGWVAMLAMFVLVAGIMWFTMAPLKKVELSGDQLIISDYRTEIRVPLEQVEKVDGRSITNPKRYTITFREPTDFGRRIVFLEPMAWTLLPWHECVEIAELRNALAEAQVRTRHG